MYLVGLFKNPQTEGNRPLVTEKGRVEAGKEKKRADAENFLDIFRVSVIYGLEFG